MIGNVIPGWYEFKRYYEYYILGQVRGPRGNSENFRLAAKNQNNQ